VDPAVSGGVDRRAEVEGLLAEDDTRMGLIWRADRDGIAWQKLVEGAVALADRPAGRSLVR
jgi:hypothetical protein